MFVARIVMGLIKGFIIGGLIGYGLAVAGMATPAALIAYPVAAVAGMLVATVAGKPIWAKDARVEVGMKAGAGALLGPLLLWVARRFLTMGVPFDVSSLPGLDGIASSPQIGMFAISSLAFVAALLGGFFDADNQPQVKKADSEKETTKKRVATDNSAAHAEAAQAEAEAEEAQSAKARSAQRKRR